MQSPRVFPRHRLIAFGVSGWIQHPFLSPVVHFDHRTPEFRYGRGRGWGSLDSERRFSEGGLDAVVNREIDCPCR